MTTKSENQTVSSTKKQNNSKIWLFMLLILIVLNVLVVRWYKPVEPEINIATESILFHTENGEIKSDPWFTLPLVGPVYLTNTTTAMALVLITLLIIAAAVRRQTKDGQLRATGIVMAIESIFTALISMVDSAVEEKWRDRIYPFFLTIFLYILIANLTKLLPFYETFGFAHPVASEGFLADKWTSFLYAIRSTPAAEGEQGYRLVSLFRGATTDLNFTLALALVTVVMIQVMGVQAHGIGYFNKFINIRAMRENPKSGLIQVFVGILELIGEIAKIASFGFRLFGNMFAGMVLLSFLGYMVPWLVNAFIMLYEAFVGILQAFIFAMLAAVFMSMAVRSEHSSS